MSYDFLKNININSLKINGLSITTILQNEIIRFKDILEKHMQKCLDSYTPSAYVRTGNFMKSISVDKAVKFNATNGTIYISANTNDNAIHKSLFGGDDANVFWLLNDGWNVRKDVWFKNIEHMGYYSGFHFVESAIKEYMSTNKYGIIVYRI